MSKILMTTLLIILLLSCFNSHEFHDNENQIEQQDQTKTLDLKKHNCVHSEISKHVEINVTDENGNDIKLDDHNKRLLQTVEKYKALDKSKVEPMRITFDYSASTMNAKETSYVHNLLAVSTQLLTRRLSVNRLTQPIKASGKCYNLDIPLKFKETGEKDSDLLIFIESENDPSESYLAYATSCKLDYSNLRPIVGLVNFNLGKMDFSPEKFEENVDTTVHEILHILGMSGHLFNTFIDENGDKRTNVIVNWQSKRSRATNALNLPKLRQFASEYWGTPVEGVELENEGGGGSAGSHWERSQLYNEMMTASSFKNGALSGFTLALLEDSGWYSVKMELAEPMFWGKGQGLTFLTQQCHGQRFREFCYNSESQCTFDYKSIGTCSDYFMKADQCSTVLAYSNSHCNIPRTDQNADYEKKVYGNSFGGNSQCAKGTIVESVYMNINPMFGCYQFKCAGGKVIFTVDGQDQTCNKEGDKVNFSGKYKGYIECPDAKSYCQSYYDDCPNSCSQHGYCIDGLCECNLGWFGADCNSQSGCPNNCSGKGTCNGNGSCTCHSGYSGNDCQIAPTQQDSMPCPQNCNGKGTCDGVNGKCVCSQGFGGDACQNKLCNVTCLNNGTCDNVSGTCKCASGFKGIGCEDKLCTVQCKNNGSCDFYTGTCKCPSGFDGSSCETKKCPICQNDGTCDTKTSNCKCPKGISGTLCEIKKCPKSCGSNGICNTKTGLCECNNGWSGAQCKFKTAQSTSSSSSTGIAKRTSVECNVKYPQWIGDGICDSNYEGYYTKECNWDGGDCI